MVYRALYVFYYTYVIIQFYKVLTSHSPKKETKRMKLGRGLESGLGSHGIGFVGNQVIHSSMPSFVQEMFKEYMQCSRHCSRHCRYKEEVNYTQSLLKLGERKRNSKQ